MNILGIADNHDSGAALVIDGELVAAVNQERIDRQKNSSAFPVGAIDAVLEIAGMKPKDIDQIVVGTSFTPSFFLRAFPTSHQVAKKKGQFSPLLHGYMVYQSLIKRMGIHAWDVAIGQKIIARHLQALRFDRHKIRMMDHHLSHANGAYRTQAKPNCLVITLDAMGDGNTATVWMGNKGVLKPLWNQSGLAAINLFYSRITQLLGFTPLRHEGKITGLAAYAEPPQELVQRFRKHVGFSQGKFTRMRVLPPAGIDDPLWDFTHFSKEQVASAAQAILEEVTIQFVRHWIKQTNCSHLALAGGVFANVKLNQKIAQLPEVNSVWVMPHMGDGGLAVGAALGIQNTPPRALQNAYLGAGPSRTDILKAAKRNNLQKHETDTIEKAATVLANQGIVARCTGKMEWGPRALGNRSVFALPKDPKINDILNHKLHRTEFMPFAPLVRKEDGNKYFLGLNKAPQAAKFMTVCFDTTTEFQEKCPAAVHVDKTARPQLIDKEANPEVHDLLTKVGQKTGTPVLINTSFNMHEEPIVCTANDGARAFVAANLDGLLMGNYFLC